MEAVTHRDDDLPGLWSEEDTVVSDSGRMCYIVDPGNGEGICYPIADEDRDAQAWEDAIDKLHELAELGGDDEWSVWVRRDVYDEGNCGGCDATDCPHRNAEEK